MVKSCAARGCTNRYRRPNEGEVAVTFHDFPKELGKMQKWLDAVGRDDLNLARIARGKFCLCSQHFTEEDFKTYGVRRRLEEDAVPSIFPTHVVRRKRKIPNSLQNCSACNCVYNTFAAEQRKDIPLHMFPKDPVRRRQWAVAVRRKAPDGGLWMPPRTAAICSLHFPEEDINRTGRTVRLRDGVTPSLFNYGDGGSVSADKKVGCGRLLSVRELEQVLSGRRRHNWVQCPPPGDAALSDAASADAGPPAQPETTSGRRLTRGTIRLRSFSTKDSMLPSSPADDLSGEPSANGTSRRRATQAVGADHRHSQRGHDSPSPVGNDDQLGRGESRFSLPKPATVPAVHTPPRLPAGTLTHHLVNLQRKQRQIVCLQKTYSSLLDKIKSRRSHPDWWQGKEDERTATNAPLLTLRDDRVKLEPPVVPLDPRSLDTLFPLTPSAAWSAVDVLRQQVGQLQVALMNTRIQVLDGELRLQEMIAAHRRYKRQFKLQRNEAERPRRRAIRNPVERSRRLCTTCPKLKQKLRLWRMTTRKEVRRANAMNKLVEKIFTSTQMRALRTGKEPRWAEEDIRRAIRLSRFAGHLGYLYVRSVMKIPLPTPLAIKRFTVRFPSLKPMYENMLAVNQRKTQRNGHVTKGPPPAARKKKRGASPHGQHSKSPALDHTPGKRPKNLTPASPLPSPPPSSPSPSLAPTAPPPPAPEAHEVESVVRDAPAEVVVRTEAVATPVTPCTNRVGDGGRSARPSCDQRDVWDLDEKSQDEETLEMLTRPRDLSEPPARSADSTGPR